MAFALQSARVRIQRFGAPLATGTALARIGASVAVAVGLVGAASSVTNSSGGVFLGLAILAGFAFMMGLLVSVPLFAMLGATWLSAHLARSRAATLHVGRSLVVERPRDVVWFPVADVVGVDAYEPGWATIVMENGDTIRAEIDDAGQASRLAAALVDGGAGGPWVAPLHPPEAPSAWPRWAAVGVTALAGVVGTVAGHGLEAVACLVGAVGTITWITVLRPRPVRRRVAVGSDGVAIRRDPWSRFVPFTRIDHVEPTELGAVLVLDGGERLPLAVVPPTPFGNGLELAWMRRESLLQRLQAGVGARGAVAGAERLARQGRSLAEWREAVRELVKDDAPGYRAAVLPPEQAARIVETGRAPPEARIGAALALSGRADAGLRQRLRIAIADCADEATQSALSEALDGRLERWTLERVARVHER